MPARSFAVKGDMIATFRKMSGLTQEDLAQKLDLNPRTIQRMEGSGFATAATLGGVIKELSHASGQSLAMGDVMADEDRRLTAREKIVLALAAKLPQLISSIDRISEEELEFVCLLGYKTRYRELHVSCALGEEEFNSTQELLQESGVVVRAEKMDNFVEEKPFENKIWKGQWNYYVQRYEAMPDEVHRLFSEVPSMFESVQEYAASLKRLRAMLLVEPPGNAKVAAIRYPANQQTVFFGGLYRQFDITLTDDGYAIAVEAYHGNLIGSGKNNDFKFRH